MSIDPNTPTAPTGPPPGSPWLFTPSPARKPDPATVIGGFTADDLERKRTESLLAAAETEEAKEKTEGRLVAIEERLAAIERLITGARPVLHLEVPELGGDHEARLRHLLATLRTMQPGQKLEIRVADGTTAAALEWVLYERETLVRRASHNIGRLNRIALAVSGASPCPLRDSIEAILESEASA